jgi:hypothetical protein
MHPKDLLQSCMMKKFEQQFATRDHVAYSPDKFRPRFLPLLRVQFPPFAAAGSALDRTEKLDG